MTAKYCPTHEMVADVLTKGLGKERHRDLIGDMGLENFDTLQSGSVKGR